MNNKDLEKTFLREAFSRNIGLLSKDEQEKIFNSKVAIAGLGGVGGAYCLALARTGFGNFSIADFDIFDNVNINRQSGATIKTIGRRKSEVMKEMILDINPYAKVEVFSEGVNEKNIDEFLSGVDVAIDGLDFFCIKERLTFFGKSREKGVISVTAGPIGFGSSVLVFDPNGVSFEKYFNINKLDSEDEMIIKFGVGICPKLLQRSYVKIDKFDFLSRKMPSLCGGVSACASIVTAESIKIILGKKLRFAPYSYQFDPFLGKLKSSRMIFGNKGLVQRIKIAYLKNKSSKK